MELIIFGMQILVFILVLGLALGKDNLFLIGFILQIGMVIIIIFGYKGLVEQWKIK